MYSIFDKHVDRIGTDCIKWDFRKEEFGRGDVVPFSIADADLIMMPEIADALIERVRSGAIGYTDLGARYFQAVNKWCSTRHGFEVSKDWITSTAGIIPAIGAAIGALLKQGDVVVTQTPVYDPFESVIKANGCIVDCNCLAIGADGRYLIDFEDLEVRLAAGAKMMILCSPHNPVGRVWTEEELRHVLNLCRKYNIILISDEIHWDIIMPGYRHVSTGSLIDDNDKVILCTAPSKTFNIAGLQTSNIIIRNNEIREKFRQWLYSRYMFCANTLGLEACIAAYEYGAKWVDIQNEYIYGNAEAVRKYIEKKIPEASVTPLEGTYLMWIDLSYLGKTSDELVKAIAERGAGLNSGKHYGVQCDGYLRMNIACPRDILMEGLESVSNAVKDIERNL